MLDCRMVAKPIASARAHLSIRFLRLHSPCTPAGVWMRRPKPTPSSCPASMIPSLHRPRMSCYNLGVDASPAMVAATQRQADERRLPVVSIAGNAEQLPLPDASYDLAWRRRATAQLPAGRARDKALSFRPRVSGAGSVSDRGVLRSRRRVPVSVDGCGAEVLRYRDGRHRCRSASRRQQPRAVAAALPIAFETSK